MSRWFNSPLVFLIACAATIGCSSPPPDESHDDAVEVETPSTAEHGVHSSPHAVDSPHGSQEATVSDDGRLNLELVSFEAPDEWTMNPAGSSFVLAEYALPPADEAEAPGRLTVSTAGGGIEDNIQRWRGQFVGDLTSETKSEFEANGLPVTMVDFSGEFNDQRGPFAPATPRAGYRMLAAIISVDGQLHFVKATGPQATLGKHLDAFQAFVKSVQRQ